MTQAKQWKYISSGIGWNPSQCCRSYQKESFQFSQFLTNCFFTLPLQWFPLWVLFRPTLCFGFMHSADYGTVQSHGEELVVCALLECLCFKTKWPRFCLPFINHGTIPGIKTWKDEQLPLCWVTHPFRSSTSCISQQFHRCSPGHGECWCMCQAEDWWGNWAGIGAR